MVHRVCGSHDALTQTMFPSLVSQVYSPGTAVQFRTKLCKKVNLAI